MVSIDALFEVIEGMAGAGATLKLSHRSGGYVVDVNSETGSPKYSSGGDTPMQALANLAKGLASTAEQKASDHAHLVAQYTLTADTAKRLAIQAKRVVDGFAQGVSE